MSETLAGKPARVSRASTGPAPSPGVAMVPAPTPRISAFPSTSVPALHLLGGLSLEGSSQLARGFETRHHVQALLGLAGASERGIARDELVDILWPDSSASAGRNRLYHTVHLARQALCAVAPEDEWVVVRNGRVQLDPRVWCDVQQLERANVDSVPETGDEHHRGTRPGAALSSDQLDGLLILCNGDWLPGLDIGAAGEAVRARVRDRQAAVLREAIERQRAQGDNPAQRALLQSLMRIQPTDEWAYRELMRLDLLAGRRHAVLRNFEKVSRELGVQLGLRPNAQTCAIAAAATAQLQDALQGLPNEQVAGALSFVGRETQIQELVAELGRGGGLWNVTGLSGVGKTSLLREVARRAAPILGNGVLIVSLGDLALNERAASACVRALGLVSNGQRGDLDLVMQAVRTRDMLLVLDDLDVAGDAQDLLDALPVGTVPAVKMQTRVIVTSRARLAHRHATHVAVRPLATPKPDASAAQAMQCAGYALFRMRCPAAMADEMESPSWRRAAVELVRRLDGLPLAIELAAARTVTMTPGEILSEIERTLRPLSDGPVNLKGRHRSLQATLDWSVQLLSAPARGVYCAVSVFPGMFGRSDVARLLGSLGPLGSARQGTGADHALDELIDAGLLARVEDSEQLRMLHLPRAHARAQALACGQWPAVVDARLREVCGQLDASALELESPTFAARLQRVIEIEADAVDLLDHARMHEPERFVRMLVPLCQSWVVRGSASTVLHWAKLGIVCAQNLGMIDAELLLRLASTDCLRRGGSAAAAEEFSRSILPLLERVTDPSLVSYAVSVRMWALRKSGRSAESVRLGHETIGRLGLGPQSPGFWTLYTPLWLMGSAPLGIEANLGLLRRRFDGSRLWPEILGVAFANSPVQSCWLDRSAIAEECIAGATRLRWSQALLSGLWHRATCQLGRDEFTRAVGTYREYQRLADSIGWVEGAERSKRLVASLSMRALDFAPAEAYLDEAAQHQPNGDRDAMVVSTPVMRAKVLLLHDRVEEAVRELLSVPTEWLPQASDEDLVEWSEVGAMVASERGHADLAADLALTMRHLDGADDHIPTIRRFRDAQFGPGEPHRPRNAKEMEELREVLRAGLQALADRLR